MSAPGATRGARAAGPTRPVRPPTRVPRQRPRRPTPDLPGQRAPRPTRARGTTPTGRQPGPGGAGAARTAGRSRAGTTRARVGRLLRRLSAPLRPATAYWVVAASGAFLLVFGLVMVLSASSVESYADTGSPFSTVARQAAFAAVGLPLAVAAARVPVRWWRRLAWPAIGVAVLLQLVVFTPYGFEVNGNRNWVSVAGVTAQPAEAVKLALVIWCAHVLARKAHLLHRLPHVLVPLVPVVAVPLALVLAGRDVGSALVLILVVAGMLFAAGVRMRHLLAGAALTATVLGYFLLSAEYRMTRVQVWLSGECADYYSQCWQLTHGQWALASGGWWGLGLGAGREKWAWLPEAHNDFIFAVIGEELGLPGTLTVLALFAALALGAVSIARATDDRFVEIAVAGLLAWVVGQALLNIGVVLGLLPVTGVPLPLVSSGGSSLVTTMVGIGMLVSFGRAAVMRR